VTGRLVVVSGPSGVGKGTVIAEALRHAPGLELATSATTRPRRPEEVDGREYHFLSEPEFVGRAGRGDFLEHVSYAGNRYGTLRSEVERRLRSGRDVVLEIEVQGARAIKLQMPEAVLVFIAPPSAEALRERLVGRGTDSPAAIDERLRTAELELEAQQEFKHVVVNDDLHRAVDELARIVESELAD
jgi:guanylate kinase